MIAGLPWTSWLLLIASVGIGLAIVLRFYLNNRPRKRWPGPDSGQ